MGSFRGRFLFAIAVSCCDRCGDQSARAFWRAASWRVLSSCCLTAAAPMWLHVDDDLEDFAGEGALVAPLCSRRSRLSRRRC